MVLVLDLGSSSVRAFLYDDQGRLAPGAVARQPLEFSTGRDGRSEDDAGRALRRVEAVLAEIISRCPPAAISAVATSAYACSLVCLDRSGQPLTPVFTYADTRSAGEARRLRQEADEQAALQRTGCRIRANYWPARIAWLRREMPAVFRETRWFVSLSDYLFHRLTGRLCSGLSVASWTGLVNRATRDWDGEWLSALGVRPEQFPAILRAGEPAGVLAGGYADRWPRLRDAAWQPAVGDGAAANVGSGCADNRRIAVTVGSTGAMRVVTPALAIPAPLPPSLWAYRVDHGHELIGGATTEGGNIYTWLLGALKLPDAAAVEAALQAMPPDGHGLTVLPMFAGERSPGFADDARATLHGLSLDTTPAAIVRACIEAISYRLAQVYDAIAGSPHVRHTGGLPELVASGGALAASPTWRQIIADATGARLHGCAEPEATSRGAALLALGAGDEAARPAQLGETHEPDPGRGAVYRAAMRRQQQLYDRLVGIE